MARLLSAERVRASLYRRSGHVVTARRNDVPIDGL